MCLASISNVHAQEVFDVEDDSVMELASKSTLADVSDSLTVQKQERDMDALQIQDEAIIDLAQVVKVDKAVKGKEEKDEKWTKDKQ